MTKRTILTGIGTYINKRGISDFGYQGQEVDVHEDFLEEFDEHNVENGDGQQVEYERIGVNMISPAAAGPPSDEEEEEDTAAKKATGPASPPKKAT